MMALFTDLLSSQITDFAYDLEASIGVRGFSRPIEVNESGLVRLSN